MKKFNRLVCAVLAAAMVLSVAGCGSSTGSTDTSAAVESGSGAENSSDANGAGTFKIGGIGPTTGGAAIYGLAVMNAAQLAVDEINAAGGVNGYQLELNFQDDEHDAEKSVNAYNVVKDWGAQMILGAVTSTPCIAVTDKTKADNMFQITPSGTAKECTQYENNFRVCFSDPDQGTAAAKYIGENNLASKIAIIYDISDTYSSGIYEAFAAEAKNQSFEIVVEESYTQENNDDFNVQLQKAKDAGADMVFLPIYYSDSQLILTQAAGMDYAPVFFSCDGMDGILGVEGFDTALTEGVMLLSPFTTNAEDELTKNFVANFEAQFGDTPNQFAADAYDAVYIIKACIEKSGITPDMSVSDICEAMKSAMWEISFTGTTGSDITWTAEGEPNKAPLVLKIVDGEYTIVE